MTSHNPNRLRDRSKAPPGEVFKRLLHYVRPYWTGFALAVTGMALYAATDPAIAWLLKPMLDGSFVDKDQTIINLVPLALMAIFVIRGLGSLISTIVMNWVASHVVMNLRNEMFAKLATLPVSYFDKHSTGGMISTFNYNADALSAIASGALVNLIRDTLTVLGLMGYLLYLNWQLALVPFAIAPPVVIIIKVASKRMRRNSRELQDSMGGMAQVVEEAVGGNRLVKVYGGEDYETHRFAKAANWVRRHFMKVKITSGIYVPLIQLLAASAMAVLVYIASQQAAQDQFTVGGFMSFIAAMGMLLSPIKRLTKVNEHLQRGIAAAESIFALLDEPSEPDSGTQQLEQVKGKIEFRNVSFSYNQTTPVLDSINLTIEPGETVAFVGQSGSGKTTLANLLPRFYNIEQGAILLDGVDIRDLQLRNLRQHIATVPQELSLFNISIAANIAYGSWDANQDEIVDAASSAAAEEFIKQLPDAYATPVGERGARLSGGQRQRVSIARAILKNAPVLILDEATSALDTNSEQLVQEALTKARRGRTTLIIAHRLSTIAAADRIAVLHQGKLVEIGSHEELMQLGGHYAQLCKRQAVPQVDTTSTEADLGTPA